MKSFDSSKEKISVIGLGYVGLPLSLLLARKFLVIGFDTDKNKIKKLQNGINPITEPGVEELMSDSGIMNNITLSDNSADLKDSKIKIITVLPPFSLVKKLCLYLQERGNRMILFCHVPLYW